MIIRIPAELKQAIQAQASRSGHSLNRTLIELLERSLVPVDAAKAADWVGDVQAVYGAAVLAILVFGSAARGELRESSDIDLLIVVRGSVNRALYRKWDESPALSRLKDHLSHPVSPHFVNFPAQDASPSSLWLEAALSGIVLWDPESEAQRALLRIRELIASGRFVRRALHGHPYWEKKEAG